MATITGASPGRSSPESIEVEDESQSAGGQWQDPHNGISPGGQGSSSQSRIATPMQKRRRVTRACDECRRKKIKCDGKQPCTHCTVYSYDCTYDQPSNRRRNPTPQYIEALELRLQRAEALLKTYDPTVDLDDTKLDALIQQREGQTSLESLKGKTARPQPSGQVPSDEVPHDAQLQSMVETTGQLDLDDHGQWDFHGGSSGAVFLQRMQKQFGGILGGDQGALFLPRPPRQAGPSCDSPRSAYDSPNDSGLPNTIDLPMRETARLLCQNALTCACCILRFVHQPTFYEMFDKIYDVPAENFGDEEHKFLPLLYVVLAVGCMFKDIPGVQPPPGETAYKVSIEQGFKYFKIGRSMVEITDSRDLTSLQCIVFMILFLQSTSNLSTCYSYIGIALRSALRMGMHRKVSTRFDPVDLETRRRVFWVIRKMDTYVSALLGFPTMLGDDDIDQELPLEIDDECITRQAIHPMPQGKVSLHAASNAHTMLMSILTKVIKYIYPIKGIEKMADGTASPSYAVSHAKIREIETDLQEWLEKLPESLKPGGDYGEDVSRAQQLLRMAFAHVQMMLYRPFLHYVSARSENSKAVDDRSYACAAAGVSVSRNIVHITTEMQKRQLLIGAYWFTMYTTFFAILSLVFFVVENEDKPGAREILADADSGRQALQALARKSMAADRCSSTLNSLWANLPEKLKQSGTERVNAKKRRSAGSAQLTDIRDTRSSPEVRTATQSATSSSNPVAQRATTFPSTIKTSSNRSSVSFDQPVYSHGPKQDHSNFTPNFPTMMAQTGMSSIANPDSNHTPKNVLPSYSQPSQFNGNNTIPDLNAMMFPSNDPFAYPDQAMMEFGNHHDPQKHEMGNVFPNSSTGGDPAQNMYLGNGLPPHTMAPPPHGMYDDLEGQLFGPLPPYLMQNQHQQQQQRQPNRHHQHNMNLATSGLDMSAMSNMALLPEMPSQYQQRQHQQQGYQNRVDLNSGMGLSFEDLFAPNGNDEWNNMMADQLYRQ